MEGSMTRIRPLGRCVRCLLRGCMRLQYFTTQGNLDVQYGGAMSYPTKNNYYITGGSPPYKPDEETPTNTNEPYLEWLEFILSQPESQIPQTISTSYGDDEQTVPEEYARCVCKMFGRLGAMGVSLLFASGDSGVGGGSCHTNDGKNTVKYLPAFPASCGFFFQYEIAI